MYYYCLDSGEDDASANWAKRATISDELVEPASTGEEPTKGASNRPPHRAPAGSAGANHSLPQGSDSESRYERPPEPATTPASGTSSPTCAA